jgi:hypothetical protein
MTGQIGERIDRPERCIALSNAEVSAQMEKCELDIVKVESDPVNGVWPPSTARRPALGLIPPCRVR